MSCQIIFLPIYLSSIDLNDVLKYSVFRTPHRWSNYIFGWLTEISIQFYIYPIVQPCDLFSFHRAEILILRSNEIREFQLCCFDSLHTLDLSCNNITNISALVNSHMITLMFLNLSDNNIGFLCKGYFENMTLLSKIDLSHNRLLFQPVSPYRLNYEPRNIGYLPKYLSWLDLSNNLLTYIPATLFSQVSLSVLNLSANRITQVEQHFHNLARLVALDLSCNHLKQLSLGESPLAKRLVKPQGEINCSLSIFRGLSNLRTLNISQNRIKFLSQTDFCDLTRLETLDLNLNQISFLSRNVFKGLDYLTCLTLRGNNIQMIEQRAFLPLHRVNTISLEDNHLSDLRDNLFDGNSNLKELQLRNNNLITVPWAVSK